MRVESENLFASTAGGEVSLIGLGSFHLGLRSGGLAAQVAVIELQQELTLANVVSFFYQQTLHGSGDRRVGFEILDGFDFAIGRNQTADRSAFHGGDADLQRGCGE